MLLICCPVLKVMTNCWGMDHPAFKKFDRLECYGGPSNKNLPFTEENLVKNQAALDDVSREADEISEVRDILKEIQSDIFILKRGVLGGPKSDACNSQGTGNSWDLPHDENEAHKGRGSRDHEHQGQGPEEPSEKPAAGLASSCAIKPAMKSQGSATLEAFAVDAGQEEMGRGYDSNEDEVLEDSRKVAGGHFKPQQCGPTRVITPEELQKHCSSESLWLVINGKVRDCTPLLGFHPGGKQVLLDSTGKEASDLFHVAHLGPSFTAASAHLLSMPLVGVWEEGSKSRTAERARPRPVDEERVQRPPSAPEADPEPTRPRHIAVRGKGTRSEAGAPPDPLEQAKALRELKLALLQLEKGHKEDVLDIGELRDAMNHLVSDMAAISQTLEIMSPPRASSSAGEAPRGTDTGVAARGRSSGKEEIETAGGGDGQGGSAVPRLDLSSAVLGAGKVRAWRAGHFAGHTGYLLILAACTWWPQEKVLAPHPPGKAPPSSDPGRSESPGGPLPGRRSTPIYSPRDVTVGIPNSVRRKAPAGQAEAAQSSPRASNDADSSAE